MDNPVLELRKLDDAHIPGASLQELGQPAQQRALRFASAKDRDAFIAGRSALRCFAASLLDVDPGRLAGNYHCPQCGPGQDHGRPGFLLDGGPAPLLLSASRASGWVLLAGVVNPAPGLRLGVDLESLEGVRFEGFDNLALTADEKASLACVPEPQQVALRARLWARKEAWLKMTGEGLRRNPAELDVLTRTGVRDLFVVDYQGEEQEFPGTVVAAMAVG